MDRAELEPLLERIAAYAAARRAGDATRSHAPADTYTQALARFRLPQELEGASAEEVILTLIRNAEPGLAAMTGPRFFGWVIGGSDPVGVAADWLTSVWGQNTGNHLATPAAAAAEESAARALLELLDLPREASVGFVTGATMANFTALCAARGEMLRRAGWDAEADGLFGAPPIHVVLGDDAHSTVFAALKFAGLGMQRVIRVPTNDQGAIRADAFEAAVRNLDGPIIAIAQAGQINTGAFDPFASIVKSAKAKGAWVHVDGAFGLWARAAEDRAELTDGIDGADSWAVDGHKALQTPYDCGYAIVRDREAHRRAMVIAASYLPGGEDEARNPSDYVPELSRRARGFSTWAIIRHLGRDGIDAMVSRHCALARRFAARLAQEPGVTIMNDVVLNQVAVRLGADLPDDVADELTRKAIARVQSGGVCFVGGAQWRGKWIVRISVIGSSTSEADVDVSAEAILEAWRAVRGA
ncbi:MAG TPA: aminotransferase class V-fold PLP-dependent enzyme [Caulobacterales bacterium]|nr:aminotransferase class V-fold PLP-dependent enzyme [Caulobacterales bacterium]